MCCSRVKFSLEFQLAVGVPVMKLLRISSRLAVKACDVYLKRGFNADDVKEVNDNISEVSTLSKELSCKQLMKKE